MTAHGIRLTGRFLAVFIGTAVALCVFAPAASADGVGPTNFESKILKVSPPTKGVHIEVVGGDSFLQVTVDSGTEVSIPGYDGEPYLHIDASGVVTRNRNSAATYLNNSRSGRVTLPDGLDSSAPASWERIGEGGKVAWHDHRIHLMSNELPTLGQGGFVQDWVVQMTVDGHDFTVSGALYHHDNIAPWSLLLTAFAALIAGLAALRLPPLAQSLLLGTASFAALLVSLGVQAVNPPGSQASPLPLILPVMAMVSCVAAIPLGSNSNFMVRLIPKLAVVALLSGWAIPLLGALWKPFVPVAAPPTLTRIAVSLVIGVAVGSAVTWALWPKMTLLRQAPRPLTPHVDR